MPDPRQPMSPAEGQTRRDIVERLLAVGFPSRADIREAAAEIERLRIEAATAVEQFRYASKALAAKDDEVKRLRAALEPFARGIGWTHQPGDSNVALALNGNCHDLRGDLKLDDFRAAARALAVQTDKGKDER